MATAATAPTGLLNLEKELICFICTEVLYQPLTLIDCLHTFCGSCLKEWFSHQYRKASHSHTPNPHPYTCPTCRTVVKDTQRNAMITTLLDMYLAANPDRARPEEEKAELAKAYTPGENILQRVDGRRRERRRREQDDAARRERTSRGSGATSEPSSSSNLLSPRHAHERSQSRGHDQRRERRIQERTQRREQRSRSGGTDDESRSDQGRSETDEVGPLVPPLSSPRHPDAVEARQRGARTVAHQASIRSLVSSSDSGTGTGDSLNEARLMQEILAEGLLDGIDVEALTEAEQDELSEVIAQRYRELHPRPQQRSTSSSAPTSPEPPALTLQALRLHEDRTARRSPPIAGARHSDSSLNIGAHVAGGTQGAQPPTAYLSRSDVGRTNVPAETDRHRQRRASDQTRQSEVRGHRATDPGVVHSRVGRSATDLTGAELAPRRLSSDQRASTEPRRSPRGSRVQQVATPPQVDSPVHLSPTSTTAVLAVDAIPRSVPQIGPAEVEGSSAVPQTLFEEPQIECYRCSRKDIQYDVYKHCEACSVDLCMRCFRTGRGCNHWFGFGYAAQSKFDASHPHRASLAMELPHLLVGRQYHRPSAAQIQSNAVKVTTSSDPALRLQEGHFCDHCFAFANSCFWSCDYCNDGEWGFCNDCVNTHHCCSHALLPIAHTSFAPGTAAPRTYDPHTGFLSPTDAHATFVRPGHGQSSPAHSAPSSVTSAADNASAGPLPDFVNLSITTHCDICTSPIRPFDSRYHCPSHPSPTASSPNQTGDYDICTGCYHNLVKIGRITRDNGPAGWRKCPSGHRMIVTVFEPSTADAGGQRRIVLNDLIGGIKMSDADILTWQTALDSAFTPPASLAGRGQWTWHDPAESTAADGGRRTRTRTSTLLQGTREEGKKSPRFPPDGGFGKVCRALWSYYPEEGDDGRGELLFPKGAVVTEVEEINEEWSDGVYAGERGLLPVVYVREV